MSEAVLEPAENPVVHPGFDTLNEQASESAVHRRSRGRGVREKEREVCDAELRHTLREIAAGLVAECEHTTLDEPQNVVRAIAEVEDVVDVLHVHVTPELRGQAIPDLLQRETEAVVAGLYPPMTIRIGLRVATAGARCLTGQRQTAPPIQQSAPRRPRRQTT